MQVIRLRVHPNYQRDFHFFKVMQKLLTPGGRALWTWWKIAAFPRTGETETHGQNSYHLRIVELVVRYAHPLPQSLSAGVIKWLAGRMNPASRV